MMNRQPRWKVVVEYKDMSEYSVSYSLIANAMGAVTRYIADVELELTNSVALYDMYFDTLKFYYSTADNS